MGLQLAEQVNAVKRTWKRAIHVEIALAKRSDRQSIRDSAGDIRGER